MIAVLNTTRTAKQRIIDLMQDGVWRSLFEYNLFGVSESAVGARLRELTQAGITETRTREGKHFKEWKLK